MQLIKKMVLLFWLPPYMYHDVFNYLVIALTLFYAFKYSSMSADRIFRGNPESDKPTLLLTIALTLFIGLRPVYVMFGDMVIYRRGFISRCQSVLPFDFSEGGEIGWAFLQDLCRVLLPGQTPNAQFELLSFIVAAVYIIGLGWGCIRIDRRHSFIIFLFIISSFSFFTYAVNGMRNGMALSMVFFALSWMNTNTRGRIFAALICAAAYTIHHSVILPSLAMFLSFYIIKNIRWCTFFWLSSIIISLVIGSYMASFFEALGFDDRLQGYLASPDSVAELRGMNLKVGFRWDFLLFSALPVAIGWITSVNRGVLSQNYALFLNTYLISNAFWIMVIRASFSSRFAYLSWFMYGLVLAYPLLNFRIFNKQGLVIAALLIFQMIMSLVI